MLFEFLQDNKVNAKAATLITDGVEEDASLLGVVISSALGFEDPQIMPVPGGDPSKSYAYTDFSTSDYENLLEGLSSRDAWKRLCLETSEADCLIIYNKGFFTRFVNPTAANTHIFDVCTVNSLESSDINHAEAEKDSNEEKVQSLIDIAEKRRKARPPVPFNTMTKDMKDGVRSSMEEDDPKWLFQHYLLKAVIRSV